MSFSKSGLGPGEIDGEEGEIHVRVVVARGQRPRAYPEEAVDVREDGEAEKFVPVRRSDRQRRDDQGPRAVLPSLSDEAREEGRRRVCEKGLPMRVSAGRAHRTAPVRDGEGILGLGAGLSEAGEEAGKWCVGLRRERVDGEEPSKVAS